MPTYAYRCPEGHEFDEVQKITAPPGATCPQCGQAAQRLITGGAGLVFKGSGFYITDYKRAGAKAKRKKDKDVKGKGDAGEKSPGTGGEGGGGKPDKPAAGSSDT